MFEGVILEPAPNGVLIKASAFSSLLLTVILMYRYGKRLRSPYVSSTLSLIPARGRRATVSSVQ